MATPYNRIYIDGEELECRSFSIKARDAFLSNEWYKNADKGQANVVIKIELKDGTEITFHPTANEVDENGIVHVYGLLSKLLPEIYKLESWKQAYAESYHKNELIKVYQLRNDSTLFDSAMAMMFKKGYDAGKKDRGSKK